MISLTTLLKYLNLIGPKVILLSRPGSNSNNTFILPLLYSVTIHRGLDIQYGEEMFIYRAWKESPVSALCYDQ